MRAHRILWIAFTLVVVTSLNGCATSYVVHKARAGYAVDSEGKRFDEKPAQPAWYLLLPASVPFDIGTLPIQGCVALAIYLGGSEGP